MQFLQTLTNIIFGQQYIELICNTLVTDLPASPTYGATLPWETSQLHSNNFSNQSYTLPLHKI